jgi:serine/threonine protein phosphatase PrpC
MSESQVSEKIVHRKKFHSGCSTIADSLSQEEDAEGDYVDMGMHPALRGVDQGMANCSIHGRTTSKDRYLPFFADKVMSFSGLKTIKKLPLGVVCHRGHKPDACNQDDFFFLASKGTLVYGIMDGHGKEGDIISQFAQIHLPGFLLADGIEGLVAEGVNVEAKIAKAFTDTQALIETELQRECMDSGCTATIVIQCPTRGKLWVANVGDSSAVIARRPKGQKDRFTTECLTVDHKPHLPNERERIEAAGGEVTVPDPCTGLPSRLVTPKAGLAVSRSLGDTASSEYGLSCIPEVFSYDISDHTQEYFILVCSDGVWEFLNAKQAVQICGKFDSFEAQRAAEKLAHKAQLRWQEYDNSAVDDITVLLVHGGYDVNMFSQAPSKESTKETLMQIGDESEGWDRFHAYLKKRLSQPTQNNHLTCGLTYYSPRWAGTEVA